MTSTFLRPERCETPTPCAWAPSLFDVAVANSPAQLDALRRLCQSCPMQPGCYLVAVTTPVARLSGFMAGLTEADRSRIQRRAVAA